MKPNAQVGAGSNSMAAYSETLRGGRELLECASPLSSLPREIRARQLAEQDRTVPGNLFWTVLPHPGPLPLGEGASSTTRRGFGARAIFQGRPTRAPSPSGSGQGEGERPGQPSRSQSGSPADPFAPHPTRGYDPTAICLAGIFVGKDESSLALSACRGDRRDKTELSRRGFLRSALVLAGLSTVQLDIRTAEASSPRFHGLIDVNVNLSRWPLRRMPLDEAPALAAKLRLQGVSQAWASSLDGLLHKDLAAVNHRLAAACRQHRLFLPFGSSNPMLPAWAEDLRRCAEVHHMRGIRLHPNYHSYTLDDPSFARLLQTAAERHLIVQLALLMEDERMMHPRLRVPPVDPAPLTKIVKATPGLKLILLNAAGSLRGDPLKRLLDAGEVYIEISMLEGVGGVANLLRQVPLDRVLFGSHAPLFYFESAALKLRESPLTNSQLQAVTHANAARLLGFLA